MSGAQEYYDGLIGQGHAPDLALGYTQQQFPDFQAAGAAPVAAAPMAAAPVMGGGMGAAPVMGGGMGAAAPLMSGAVSAVATASPFGGGAAGAQYEMNMTQLLFKFDGRINRQRWWLWGILIGLVQFGVVFGALAALTLSGAVTDLEIIALVGMLAGLPFLYMQVALHAKRFQDRDKAGIAGIIIGASVWLLQIGAIYMPALNNGASIVAIVLLATCGFPKGTQGSNQYGADPLG